MADQKGKVAVKEQVSPAIAGGPKYILRLFVSGILINSIRAIKNLNHICELHLKGDFKLEIIDIYQQPELAIDEQIIVVPVMIIKHPLPERRIIGDLSDVDKVLEVLNLN
jgi:circadian clock protein KaiB